MHSFLIIYFRMIFMAQMSLRVLNEQESGAIVKINAERHLRKHLTEIGFDPGSIVTVINKGASDLMVVQIKGCCRVAISTDMAAEIIVDKFEEPFVPPRRGRHRRERQCRE